MKLTKRIYGEEVAVGATFFFSPESETGETAFEAVVRVAKKHKDFNTHYTIDGKLEIFHQHSAHREIVRLVEKRGVFKIDMIDDAGGEFQVYRSDYARLLVKAGFTAI